MEVEGVVNGGMHAANGIASGSHRQSALTKTGDPTAGSVIPHPCSTTVPLSSIPGIAGSGGIHA